jgi:heme A synthase
MLQGLLHTHSFLRYLVFGAAALHLGYSAVQLYGNQPFNKVGRVLSAVSMSLIHVQVILGLSMVGLGVFYPKLIGHLVLMLLAAVLVTVMHSKNRRAPVPNWKRPLVGTAGALLLIVLGILSIGRGVFSSTVF